MPKLVKGTPEEREQFMFDVFQKFYSDPANAGKNLSVGKANKEHIKRFGSMLRNKRAYEIRASVQAQLGRPAGKVTVAARPAGSIAEAVQSVSGSAPAALITGNPEQLAFLGNAFAQLRQAGLVSLKIDHLNSSYAVVVAV